MGVKFIVFSFFFLFSTSNSLDCLSHPTCSSCIVEVENTTGLRCGWCYDNNKCISEQDNIPTSDCSSFSVDTCQCSTFDNCSQCEDTLGCKWCRKTVRERPKCWDLRDTTDCLPSLGCPTICSNGALVCETRCGEITLQEIPIPVTVCASLNMYSCEAVLNINATGYPNLYEQTYYYSGPSDLFEMMTSNEDGICSDVGAGRVCINFYLPPRGSRPPPSDQKQRPPPPPEICANLSLSLIAIPSLSQSMHLGCFILPPLPMVNCSLTTSEPSQQPSSSTKIRDSYYYNSSSQNGFDVTRFLVVLAVFGTVISGALGLVVWRKVRTSGKAGGFEKFEEEQLEELEESD